MKIDYNILNDHKQIHIDSCVPMSVECVLKLIKVIDSKDFPFQIDHSKYGDSNWIYPSFIFKTLKHKIKFIREFKLKDIGLNDDRGPHFMTDYYDSLFERIDDELSNNRFVIISLESDPNKWHMFVIFDRNDDTTYKTITYYLNHPKPVINDKHDLKTIVSKMEGTDILTYKEI